MLRRAHRRGLRCARKPSLKREVARDIAGQQALLAVERGVLGGDFLLTLKSARVGMSPPIAMTAHRLDTAVDEFYKLCATAQNHRVQALDYSDLAEPGAKSARALFRCTGSFAF